MNLKGLDVELHIENLTRKLDETKEALAIQQGKGMWAANIEMEGIKP